MYVESTKQDGVQKLMPDEKKTKGLFGLEWGAYGRTARRTSIPKSRRELFGP